MLKLLGMQVGAGAALAAAIWAGFGSVAGYSALLGSVACVAPNAFLALRLAAPRRDPGARALLRAVWVGEAGKLALTVLIFSLVFTMVRPLAAAPMFAGFIATQLVTFGGLLLGDGQGQKETTSKKNGD